MSQSTNLPDRVFLYPKDLHLITGQSLRTCRAKIREVKMFFGRHKRTLITVREYCFYFDLDEDYFKPDTK